MRRLLLFLLLPLVAGLVGPAGGDPPQPAPKPAPKGKEKPPEAPEPGVPDAALQEAINKAIDRGAAYLRGRQTATGAMPAVVQRGEGRYQLGSSCLAGLALLASGDEPGTASVDRILAFVRETDSQPVNAAARTTYDSALMIMFVTEYFRHRAGPPKEEKGHTRTAKPPKNPCALPADALAWVQGLADFLVRAQKETGGWGYPAHREDNSNTQYALLGLRAARDCGANVPPTTFEKAMGMALLWQEADGPKQKRLIPGAGPGSSPYVIDSPDRARGFPYLRDPYLATGSMTTSGIAILAISHDALLRPRHLERYDGPKQNATTQAIQDAFAWLDKHFDVTRNPPGNAPNWHLYYLYGLERACALAGRPLVGLHDWYLEGARHLVSIQKEDGRWATGALGIPGEFEASDVLDTAWALLFLKRATRPIQPIPPPVVTSGG
jgi:hypothetical protein